MRLGKTTLPTVGSLLLLITLCFPGSARARVKPADKATAHAHFARGKKLFIQKRYVQAAAAFTQALRHWRHHSILFNLALAQALAGNPVQAVRTLRQYLAITHRPQTQLPAILRQARGRVALLQIQVRHPPDAAIYVDGRLAGRGRAEVVVLPGQRVIEIRQESRVLRRRLVQVQAGGTKSLEIELPRAPPRPARPGLRPPPRRPPSRPVVAPVGGGASPQPRPRGRVHWAGFATATAVTLAGLAAAVALSVKTEQLHNEFETRRWDEDLAARGDRYQTATNAVWGATAAAALGTVLLAIFTRWSSKGAERPAVLIQPTLHPGGAGLSARLALGF